MGENQVRKEKWNKRKKNEWKRIIKDGGKTNKGWKGEMNEKKKG